MQELPQQVRIRCYPGICILHLKIFLALWIADYLETLPAEVQLIWMKKQSGTTLLFIFNRYSFLLYVIFNLITAFPGQSTDNECNVLTWLYGLPQTAALVSTNGENYVFF
ncbi:hypothetical protein GYMLUDRAFT_410115 [Collybiopsis luxurians FD-317 M1]|uniref:DUF6533 domain-containing protein n=1 Tax=Collybiopsis luxurians FD-317 M1 TaxID=944289 RepID=A0A0D0AL50_9AGAR|nr:hypothetical protein GYMLUDRAFT_410115 [Collybiopsis luxurians FD-317 M1]